MNVIFDNLLFVWVKYCSCGLLTPIQPKYKEKTKGDTYLDAQTVCVPLVPNLSVVVLVVRPFLPNVIVGRVHVVTSLSIDDLVFVRFVNSRYMPMVCRYCKKKGGLRLIWIRGFFRWKTYIYHGIRWNTEKCGTFIDNFVFTCKIVTRF